MQSRTVYTRMHFIRSTGISYIDIRYHGAYIVYREPGLKQCVLCTAWNVQRTELVIRMRIIIIILLYIFAICLCVYNRIMQT